MKTRPALLGLLTLVVAGCVSIPSEAPELSQTLGYRLKALENANITLLQRYFDLKRRDIDRFIADEWVPKFAPDHLQQTTGHRGVASHRPERERS